MFYGYFDNDTLKIAATKLQDFDDAANYVANMDSLLRWAFPVTQGGTKVPVPLPSISEECDESGSSKEENNC